MVEDYNKIIPDAYDARFNKNTQEAYLQQHWWPLIMGAIENYCRGKLVLDLACGTGTFTTAAMQYANYVVGVDISKVMLNYAKSKNSNLNLILADTYCVPLKNNSIDVIICIGLFEYVKRPLVINEMSRLLKTNGICIVQCANKYSLARLPWKMLCKIKGIDYAYDEPSYKEIVNLFERNGFEIIESKMNDGLVWLPYLLDKYIGKQVYTLVERLFKSSKKNPFSNAIMFVTKKLSSRNKLY